MRIRQLPLFIAAFLVFINIAAADTLFRVETRLGNWTDKERSDRDVPYKMYIPADAKGALPVVLFSHGLGGTRDGAAYLLEYLAAHGYVVVAVQHHGSDGPALFGGSGEPVTQPSQSRIRETTSPAAAVERFKDIPFAIDALEEMNRSDAGLHGRLDMSHVGMSGHSFGAITTLVIAGQSSPRAGLMFADDRIKAAIAYSPSKPRQGDPADAFANILVPTFHMTGTDDHNPFDASEPPSDRQIPYRSITRADRFLLVFNGGDHMVYSGRERRGGARPNDQAFQALVQKASLAYWDMYLRGNAEARTYLTGEGFRKDLGTLGTFEFHVQ
jgi:predicted dienelactone hydrolase